MQIYRSWVASADRTGVIMQRLPIKDPMTNHNMELRFYGTPLYSATVVRTVLIA